MNKVAISKIFQNFRKHPVIWKVEIFLNFGTGHTDCLFSMRFNNAFLHYRIIKQRQESLASRVVFLMAETAFEKQEILGYIWFQGDVVKNVVSVLLAPVFILLASADRIL